MKKLFLSFALSLQIAAVFAQTPVKLKSDNVNLYRQPTSKGEVIKVLNSTEDVVLVRKFNADWSIVTVGTESGYVHNTYLPKIKKQPVSATAAKQ
jgi:uncharacterized protein YgiM (DUF1202 family)